MIQKFQGQEINLKNIHNTNTTKLKIRSFILMAVLKRVIVWFNDDV